MKKKNTIPKVEYHGDKEKKSLSRKKNPNVVSMSKDGYGDGSPHNTLPYIDIDTPSGRIDMSNTGIPLWAMVVSYRLTQGSTSLILRRLRRYL